MKLIIMEKKSALCRQHYGRKVLRKYDSVWPTCISESLLHVQPIVTSSISLP
jgi:hypothetical protein